MVVATPCFFFCAQLDARQGLTGRGAGRQGLAGSGWQARGWQAR